MMQCVRLNQPKEIQSIDITECKNIDKSLIEEKAIAKEMNEQIECLKK